RGRAEAYKTAGALRVDGRVEGCPRIAEPVKGKVRAGMAGTLRRCVAEIDLPALPGTRHLGKYAAGLPAGGFCQVQYRGSFLDIEIAGNSIASLRNTQRVLRVNVGLVGLQGVGGVNIGFLGGRERLVRVACVVYVRQTDIRLR